MQWLRLAIHMAMDMRVRELRIFWKERNIGLGRLQIVVAMKKYDEQLVSIIIPIFNSEKYLKRCINSILVQTYENIEVILLNDGSTDTSLQICEHYAKIDDRVVILNKHNTGVSDTRNKGLEYANGKYIMFVDSDDWIPKNSVELLLTTACKSDADCCIGAVSEIALTNRVIGAKNNDNFRICSDIDCIKLFSEMDWGPWGKLYKTKLINENNIRFQTNIKYMEDAIFVSQFLSVCDVVTSTKRIVYKYYRLNETSATSKFYLEFYLWKCKFVSELRHIYKGKSEAYTLEMKKQCCKHCYNTISYYLEKGAFCDTGFKTSVMKSFKEILIDLDASQKKSNNQTEYDYIFESIMNENPDNIIERIKLSKNRLVFKDCLKRILLLAKKTFYEVF